MFRNVCKICRYIPRLLLMAEGTSSETSEVCVCVRACARTCVLACSSLMVFMDGSRISRFVLGLLFVVCILPLAINTSCVHVRVCVCSRVCERKQCT
jgi:hypothetical protein